MPKRPRPNSFSMVYFPPCKRSPATQATFATPKIHKLILTQQRLHNLNLALRKNCDVSRQALSKIKVVVSTAKAVVMNEEAVVTTADCVIRKVKAVGNTTKAVLMNTEAVVTTTEAVVITALVVIMVVSA